jgi:choline/glycine/proline betaine transport protein
MQKTLGRTNVAAVALVTLVTGIFALFGGFVDGFFEQLRNAVTDYTGWFMIGVVNAALVAMGAFGLMRFRHLRLGGEDAEPEFSRLAWLGMLFAAGMGIGLLFYGVFEPLEHFRTLRELLPSGDVGAARLSMAMTFLHWGFHPWAVYGIVALALAWFHYNKDQPLSFEGPLVELVPKRWRRPSGAALNTLAILGTVFGVSTSLGLGASQAATGLDALIGIGDGLSTQIALVIVVCLAATASVASGVGNGVRVISTVNLIAALVLMLFVLLVGETVFALKATGQNMGYYLNNLLEIASWRDTYSGMDWQADWTLFYWAWWIAWSPFVGLFIARVSYGRSIGEFVLAVLIVPSVFNFIWLSVFGANALHDGLFGSAQLLDAGATDSLFALLDTLPLSTVSIALATAIVLLFFVTSADSGALVTSTLAAGGIEPGPAARGFWAIVVLIVTAVLLTLGGLDALQTATIVSGFPFALVLLAVGAALARSLRATLPPHYR